MSELVNSAAIEGPVKLEVSMKVVEYGEMLDELKGFTITSDEDFKLASEILLQTKKHLKSIEARRKEVTDPLNKALTAIRSWFKPAEETLEQTEAFLKKEIASYSLRLQKANEEAAREAALAAQRNDFDGAHTAHMAMQTLPSAKGITVTERWEHVVEDVSLVPREFLTVDHSAVKIYLKNAVQAGEEPAPIPGIRFEKVGGVTARPSAK